MKKVKVTGRSYRRFGKCKMLLDGKAEVTGYILLI